MPSNKNHPTTNYKIQTFNSRGSNLIRLNELEIVQYPDKGRGVVTRKCITKDSIIETAPILFLEKSEMQHIRNTNLWKYMFEWITPDLKGKKFRNHDSQKNNDAPQIIALGIISLVNHSNQPNAKYIEDFNNNYMLLIANKNIKAGEEITIDYKCDLWFHSHL